MPNFWLKSHLNNLFRLQLPWWSDMLNSWSWPFSLARPVGFYSLILTYFFQNFSGIDDCASPNSSPFCHTPILSVSTKTEYRNQWKEIIVQWGPLQFLGIGGFYGEQGSLDKRAFLGSALPQTCPLTDETYDKYSIVLWTIPANAKASSKLCKSCLFTSLVIPIRKMVASRISSMPSLGIRWAFRPRRRQTELWEFRFFTIKMYCNLTYIKTGYKADENSISQNPRHDKSTAGLIRLSR